MFCASEHKRPVKIEDSAPEDSSLKAPAEESTPDEAAPGSEETNDVKENGASGASEPASKTDEVSSNSGEPVSDSGEAQKVAAPRTGSSSVGGFAAMMNSAVAAATALVVDGEGDQMKANAGAEADAGEAKSSGETKSSEEAKSSAAKAEDAQQEASGEEGENKSTHKVPLARDCKTKEDVTQYIIDRVNAIKEQETYDNDIVLKNLKGIGRIYWDVKSKRSVASKALVDCNFGELAVKMMRAFNQIGVFSNDTVWFPCYYVYNNCWNYSDSCKALCQQLCDAGMISVLLSNITHQPYLDNMSSKNVLNLVKASLSILSNIARVPETKPIFTEKNAVAAVKPFTESTIIFFKLVSMLLLTNIISEEENATLEDTGALSYTIKSLKSALESPKRRHRGFDPNELAEGLSRMAVNDSNKMKIIENGALPLLVKMMKDNHADEQQSAAQVLWTLSFGEEPQKHILAEPDCITELERLSASDNAEIRRVAKGALWVLQDKADTHAAQAEGSDSEKKSGSLGHVFISYNWDHQETIVALGERLKADGYRVWLDVDQMGGSTLEAMAGAVEEAAVVLIGLSEKYKMSPNCRTEAEYTFQLHKPIVPLMMQRRYRADGWLGMLVGAKLYINFDGKYAFDDAYQMLLKELQGRGKDAGEGMIEAAVAPVTGSAPVSSFGRTAEVKAWGKEKVVEWLAENELHGINGSLRNIDGKLLIRFNKIRHEAPEFFYQTLDRKLGLDTISLLRFTEALDDLLK